MSPDEIDFSRDTPLEAYDSGYDAYYCTHRKTLEDNPYPKSSPNYDAWARGWLEAHGLDRDE